MPPASLTSPIACTASPLSLVETDLLIVPWFEGEEAGAVPGLNDATGGELARALASKEFQAKPYDLFLAAVTDASWRTRRVALVGGGCRADGGSELARKLAAAAGLAARDRRVARAAFVVRGEGDVAELAQAVAEGLTLSEFSIGRYKTEIGRAHV